MSGRGYGPSFEGLPSQSKLGNERLSGDKARHGMARTAGWGWASD